MSELDRGYLYERVQFDHLERFLAEEWERRAPGDLYSIIGREPDDSDRWTAASLFQWLGTNCGFALLCAVFRKAGYAIVQHTPTYHVLQSAEDPMVASMELIINMDDYIKTDVANGERLANQLTFDLSEPT